MPHTSPNLAISGGESSLQHWDDLGENPLAELPNEVPEGAGGHLALVGRIAAEEGEEERDEGWEDLSKCPNGVGHDHLPYVERCLTHH